MRVRAGTPLANNTEVLGWSGLPAWSQVIDFEGVGWSMVSRAGEPQHQVRDRMPRVRVSDSLTEAVSMTS